MSGSPSEAEVRDQWKKSVAIVESLRNHFDGTVMGAGGLIDSLVQVLEGEYTPAGLTGAVTRMRAGMSSLIDSQRITEFLAPVLLEYGRLIDQGSAYTNPAEAMRALAEYFKRNTITIKSRTITYDTSATLGGTNVGNGVVSRLTVDEWGYNLEACHVEKKLLRCRQDLNTGANEHAEVFEVVGTRAPVDALQVPSFGSGDGFRAQLVSRHAGSGSGGSLLKNSSFDSYSSTASPKFTGWTEVAGGSSIAQDTTAGHFYRSNPSANTDGALKITGGAGTVTLRQGLDQMARRDVDPATPYFLRVMVNKTVGTAVGGTFTIRLGAQSVDTSIASIGSGWQEILIPIGTACWPRSFNVNPFRIEIEWSTSTSGYLLVDDVIFCPWDQVDGTFWIIRQNAATPTAWLLDDTLEFTDTGGAPATGKLQYWLWIAGLGCLPSSGSPTITDP